MNARVVHVINSILVGCGVAFYLYLVSPVPSVRGDWPMWEVIALAGGCGIGLYWYRARKPRHKPVPPGQCRKCGYNLTGNVSGRCPECGTPTGDTKSG